MGKEIARRKRSIQVKFRLTPEENAIFLADVEKSGMSKNAYLIKTVINRMGLSAISCERQVGHHCVDIRFTIGKKTVGYASCLFFEEQQHIQVSSFYVIKPLQDMGIEEMLLQEISSYAELCGASSIVAYPGQEPYCPTEWKPLDVQKEWYLDHGFTHTHDVCGVTPCMVKELVYES